jgi:hypothetical protein
MPHHREILMAPLTRVRVHLRSLPPRQRAVVVLLALFSCALALTHVLPPPAGLLLEAAAALALLSALILSLSQQPPASRRWLILAAVAVMALAFVAGVALSRLAR